MQESFKKFKRLLTPRAKQYNLRVPKGIMLVGRPGTGKSHSANASSIFCETVIEHTYASSKLPTLELTIEVLLEERRQINPLAICEADRVESMRNKADQQALPSWQLVLA